MLRLKHASLVCCTTQFALQHTALQPHPMAITSNSNFTYHGIMSTTQPVQKKSINMLSHLHGNSSKQTCKQLLILNLEQRSARTLCIRLNASTTRPKSLHQAQSTLHPPSIMHLIAKLMAPGLMFAGIRSNRPMSSPPKPLSLICTVCGLCKHR